MPWVEYITTPNEVLDAICHAHYGEEHGTTELVLAANPGLADYGAHLPEGMVIRLPVIATDPQPLAQTVSLWD